MKQNSKTKMLALLLAAMMSMTALSGCSDNKKPQEQSTAEQTEQTEQTEQSQTKPEETTEQSAGQTEKMTLSDESGLAQFNNPDKDSEVAILPHNRRRHRRDVLSTVCTQGGGKFPDPRKGWLL